MEREIIHIQNNPELTHLYAVSSDIVYRKRGNRELKLSLILPWDRLFESTAEKNKLPLIVFVQGSGWTTPDYGPQLPQMCELARAGFIVAMVGHSDGREGCQFPGYLEDVKCAIRYLRAHAEKYGINEEHVGILGTSSGGNTAMLVGLTGDDSEYRSAEYTEYSDSVTAVAECFGPTELKSMFETWKSDEEIWAKFDETWRGLYSKKQMVRENQIQEMSPVKYEKKKEKYPSFLLMHGTSDKLVAYTQMIAIYDYLTVCGADIHAYAVDGAPHEESFWSSQVFNIILDFMSEKLK